MLLKWGDENSAPEVVVKKREAELKTGADDVAGCVSDDW